MNEHEKLKELLDYFKHMEKENTNCLLGGMVWDDIALSVEDAKKLGISTEELEILFPLLFK